MDDKQLSTKELQQMANDINNEVVIYPVDLNTDDFYESARYEILGHSMLIGGVLKVKVDHRETVFGWDDQRNPTQKKRPLMVYFRADHIPCDFSKEGYLVQAIMANDMSLERNYELIRRRRDTVLELTLAGRIIYFFDYLLKGLWYLQYFAKKAIKALFYGRA